MAKENQHFVPQGYLRGFTCTGEKSLVWEYDKRGGELPKQKSIRAICSAPFYYAQYDEKGTLDKERLENAFHAVEQKTPKIIRGITPIHTRKVDLSAEQRTILGFFICLLLTRGPGFRDGIEEWAAAGFKDTELGVWMKPEVRHGATNVYARVQA